MTYPQSLSDDPMCGLQHSGWWTVPLASCNHMHSDRGRQLWVHLVDQLQVACHPSNGLLACRGLPQEHGEVVRAGRQPLRPATPGSLIPVIMDKASLSWNARRPVPFRRYRAAEKEFKEGHNVCNLCEVAELWESYYQKTLIGRGRALSAVSETLRRCCEPHLKLSLPGRTGRERD